MNDYSTCLLTFVLICRRNLAKININSLLSHFLDPPLCPNPSPTILPHHLLPTTDTGWGRFYREVAEGVVWG